MREDEGLSTPPIWSQKLDGSAATRGSPQLPRATRSSEFPPEVIKHRFMSFCVSFHIESGSTHRWHKKHGGEPRQKRFWKKIVKIKKNCGGGKSWNHEKIENESNNYQFVIVQSCHARLDFGKPFVPPRKIEIFWKKKRWKSRPKIHFWWKKSKTNN